MPALENPKHEEFALLLARGVKQGKAYVQAGYTENKGAASRLAQSVKIQDRVEELRREIDQKITTAMSVPSEENFSSLAEMGLTMEWVALQFRNIYEESVKAGSYSSANTAVSNIQKLIEIEKNGSRKDEQDAGDRISVKDTLALLKGFKEALRDADSDPDMIDITPKDGRS